MSARNLLASERGNVVRLLGRLPDIVDAGCRQ
ncbi:hypothetical protein NCR_01569 [Burkholderia pseudomallei]